MLISSKFRVEPETHLITKAMLQSPTINEVGFPIKGKEDNIQIQGEREKAKKLRGAPCTYQDFRKKKEKNGGGKGFGDPSFHSKHTHTQKKWQP